MMAPHYSAAWAWAGNCPFQWGKQVASHLGGTRDPMVVRWPERIREQGGLRTPVHARHRHRPDDPRGRRHPAADARRRRRAEADARHELRLLVRRRGRARAAHAAVLRDPRQPRRCTRTAGGCRCGCRASRGGSTRRRCKQFAPGVWDPDNDPVELYYLPDDFSQANDLAAEHPEKVDGAPGSCSGRRPSATTCRRCSAGSPPSSASVPPLRRADEVHLLRRRAERRARA